MPLPLSSTLFLSPLVALFISFFAGLPTPSFSDDVSYAECNRTFSCGSVQNISYPFAGGDRPDHCGLPGLRLTCRDNQTELLSPNPAATYRVLHIDQTRQTMTLSRLDLWNETCPARFVNTTLNSTLFSPGVGNQDLTLFYGCNSSAMPMRPYNRFVCNVVGFNYSDSYYLVGPVPSDPILRFVQCATSIAVPILWTAGGMLTSNQTTLENVLMEGFNVNYSDPYDRQCSQCNGSGGQCGLDPNSGEPICICDNRLCPPPPQRQGNGNGNGNGAPLSIALPLAGAVLAGIGVGWLIFFCRQRKKRLAAQAAAQNAQSADSESKKDLLSPPSSKGLKDMTMTHPSTHFTQSIPSYPSLKSEAGKNSSYFGVQVFSYDELEEATDNFDPSKELGDGGFGAVYYGKLNDGRIVAVKRLYENNFKRVEQFMNEVEILTHLRHENLVVLYGCTSKRSRELLLVYEYIPNGTVADHLNGKRAKSGLLSWPIRLNIAVETAEALSYLHSSDIIHRDVKTTNILLDNDFHVKVADFGLSRLFPTDVTHVSTAPQGTPGYVDPEYYQCYQLTEKSDVYSFGVVLIELISSLPAVDTNRHRHDINLASMAVNKIQNRALNELVDPSLGFETTSAVRRAATLVAELAFRCLQQDKDMRPSMKEVVEVLRGIQNDNLNGEKVEVVEILMEDVVDLKDDLLQLSPDSVATGKSIGGSTTADSSV